MENGKIGDIRTLKALNRSGGKSGTVDGRSPNASFGFYIREEFQSQTSTEKVNMFIYIMRVRH